MNVTVFRKTAPRVAAAHQHTNSFANLSVACTTSTSQNQLALAPPHVRYRHVRHLFRTKRYFSHARHRSQDVRYFLSFLLAWTIGIAICLPRNFTLAEAEARRMKPLLRVLTNSFSGLRLNGSPARHLKFKEFNNFSANDEHQDGRSFYEGDQGDEGDDQHQVGEITKGEEMAEHLQRNHEARSHLQWRNHGEIIYSGEIRAVGGKKYRYGVVTYADGAVHEGEFFAEKFEGKGKYTAAGEKWWYEGFFKAGEKHGYGVLHINSHVENGDGIYVGNLDIEVAWEHLRYISPDGEYLWVGQYAGNFAKDQKHGHGTLTWASGAKYVGNFDRDQPHGKGKYISSTSLVRNISTSLDATGTPVPSWAGGKAAKAYYEGGWNAGMKHGYGVEVFANGDKYHVCMKETTSTGNLTGRGSL
jgi:hypothetical protein